MRRRQLHSAKLRRLVHDFEESVHAHTLIYFDEKELLDIINFYEQKKLLHKAIEAVDIAITQYEYRVDFFIYKARLLYKAKQYDLAWKTLNRAENISPIELDIQLLKIKVLSASHRFTEAFELVEQCESLISKSDYIDLLLAKGMLFEHMKDYEQLFRIMTEAIRISPERKDILDRLWMAVEFSKNYEESISIHTAIIDKQPYNAYAWYNLGHAYACLGEYDAAIDALEYSFIIEPYFEMGYKDCAELCEQQRYFAKALQIRIEEEKRFGPDSEVFAAIGSNLVELGSYNKALVYLRKATHLDPLNEEISYLLGRCFYFLKQYNKAEKHFIKAIQGQDRREEFFAGLAETYIAKGEVTKADYYYRKATETGPEQLMFWLDHAQFLLRQESFEKALQVLEEAEYHTVGVELAYGKAICLFLLGEKHEALLVLEQALQEDVSKQDIIYTWSPNLLQIEEVQSMINYYLGDLHVK